MTKVQFPNISLFPLWGPFNQSLLKLGPKAYLQYTKKCFSDSFLKKINFAGVEGRVGGMGLKMFHGLPDAPKNVFLAKGVSYFPPNLT